MSYDSTRIQGLRGFNLQNKFKIKIGCPTIQLGFKDFEVLSYKTTLKLRLDVLIIGTTFVTKETNSHFRTKSPYTKLKFLF